jgi:proteasome lid subunit RPN8/RPN11
MNAKLFKIMLQAAESCTDPIEEQGGIILSKNNEYCFVKVKNIHEGTATAAGLYETDQTELRENVLTRVGDGWKFYASFHTHPQWSSCPSSLDLEKLFQGFRYNIIFAPTTNMFSHSEWIGEQSAVYYIPKKTVAALTEV